MRGHFDTLHLFKGWYEVGIPGHGRIGRAGDSDQVICSEDVIQVPDHRTNLAVQVQGDKGAWTASLDDCKRLEE